ncbi:HlyD family efflux transporter periplasmic adaptor subunit [Gymnodinialimonas sp. 2305UL16-5]|uniref:HlyD family efflux transporter periplasmic adaptor subunit n=1 Tax=Gymnodinialimonas mytili TaxID=3126503 RepID=UPI0030ADE1F5
MHIRHERPMSDLAFQVSAPLGLELATGEVVTISSWSLEGLTFPGDSDVVPKEATLSIPFQGVDIRFPVRLISGAKSRFLRFDGLSGRQRETLAVFYRSLLSGRMAATDEIITSLDAPVDLVPMGETEEEKDIAIARKTPRSVRVVLSTLIYLTLGALVFWTLGSGIANRLATLNIRNARIEAPLIPHSAAQGAYVDEIIARPGDNVAAGDVLIRLTTPAGEAALSEVRGRIDLVEQRLRAAEDRAVALNTRLASARAALVDAVARASRADLEAANAALDAFDGGYAPVHMTLFEMASAARRDMDTLTEELRRLRRERGRLRDASDALHIMAAQAGVVTQIAVLDGQFVPRGAIAAELESQAARQARGWVDHSMAAAFHPGMAVSVTLNTGAGAQRLDGQIIGLEAGIDPELSPDFGMLVTVGFPDLAAEQSRTDLPHLMPVELVATREWAIRARALLPWRAR